LICGLPFFEQKALEEWEAPTFFDAIPGLKRETWGTRQQIAEAIKADQESLKLQNQFFEDSQHPLDTKQ
jgi:hypothetical protein